MKYQVGVIGAGRIGKLHAENLIKAVAGVQVAAIADPFCDNIKEWAEELGIPKVYADYHDILKDEAIDAVLICSPTNTHSTITIEAAKAGKHIFCEKPIDYDLDKIREALEAVEEAGVTFQVGFNRRFDHNFKAVRQLVTDGKVGDVHIVKVTSRDPAPPPVEYVKVSGGLFLDMMIHDFDMVRYLSNSEVEEVFASGAVLVDPAIGEAGDVDTAVVTLKFKNGALGIIDNSRKAAYGYDQRVEVFGSKGCVTVENDTDNSTKLSTEESVTSLKPKYFFLERYKDSFIDEVNCFFDAIRNGTKPIVGSADGLNAVKVALAAKESLATGRPVKITY